MTSIALVSTPIVAVGIPRQVAPAASAGATRESARQTVRAALHTAGTAVYDAVTSAARAATARDTPLETVADRVATAVEDLNEVLDDVASSELSADFRVSVAIAVREAVASLPDAAASGLTLDHIDGGENLVIDMAALAESLANDPEALAALVNGPQGLPEALNVALAEEAEAMAVADAAPSATIDEEPELEMADIVRSASQALTQRAMQLLDSFQAAPLSRLDVFV
jgi:hypothetical protein